MGLEKKMVFTNVVSYTPAQPPEVQDNIGLCNRHYLVPEPFAQKQMAYIRLSEDEYMAGV